LRVEYFAEFLGLMLDVEDVLFLLSKDLSFVLSLDLSSKESSREIRLLIAFAVHTPKIFDDLELSTVFTRGKILLLLGTLVFLTNFTLLFH